MTAIDIALDLDAIEARANAATPGPWTVGSRKWRQGAHEFTAEMVFTRHGCLFNDTNGMNDSDDSAFIAHAREDIPALVAEVRRLRAVESGVPASR